MISYFGRTNQTKYITLLFQHLLHTSFLLFALSETYWHCKYTSCHTIPVHQK